ncbi:hypothetical protein AADZ91_00335 [Colwelliaceae bacterium 6441]
MLSLITVCTLMMLPAITLLAFSLLVSAFERKPNAQSTHNTIFSTKSAISSNLVIEL